MLKTYRSIGEVVKSAHKSICIAFADDSKAINNRAVEETKQPKQQMHHRQDRVSHDSHRTAKYGLWGCESPTWTGCRQGFLILLQSSLVLIRLYQAAMHNADDTCIRTYL